MNDITELTQMKPHVWCIFLGALPTLLCLKKKERKGKKEKNKTLKGFKGLFQMRLFSGIQPGRPWWVIRSWEIIDPWALCWVLTLGSATQRWDKDSLAWGEVEGGKGRKEEIKRGSGNSLDASSSAAPARPFISATCEDGRGETLQALVCRPARSRPAKKNLGLELLLL